MLIIGCDYHDVRNRNLSPFPLISGSALIVASGVPAAGSDSRPTRTGAPMTISQLRYVNAPASDSRERY
jgi:hypothetical protein